MNAGLVNSSAVIAEQDQIIGMWRAGATVPNIAFEVGRGTMTIKRWIRLVGGRGLSGDKTSKWEATSNVSKDGRYDRGSCSGISNANISEACKKSGPELPSHDGETQTS